MQKLEYYIWQNEAQAKLYLLMRLVDDFLLLMNREFSAAEREWIRLMQNPYASLSLWDPDDDATMIQPKDHGISAYPKPLPNMKGDANE